MKIAHVTNYYPQPLEKLYRDTPGLADQPYEVQIESVLSLKFGWSDAWKCAIEPLGHRVLEVVANAAQAQSRWWCENVSENHPSESNQVVFEQLSRFRPDIVLLDDCANFPSLFCEALRNAVPNVGRLVGWCGAPFTDIQGFQCYNAILSNIPSLVGQFRKCGFESFLIPHAFDRRAIAFGEGVEREKSLTFCGSLQPTRQSHLRRIDLLARVSREAEIEVYADVPSIPSTTPRWTDRFFPNKSLQAYSKAKQLQPKDALFGSHMYKLLAASKVTLNVHIDISGGEASNMRLFEATGMGSCLLTDGRTGMDTFFRDDEVVLFESRHELLERLRWLRDNPRQAEEIGRRGQSRTLNTHTFEHRAPLLLESFEQVLAKTKLHDRS